MLSAAGIGERTYDVKIVTLLLCFIIIALTSIFSLSNRKKILQIQTIQNDLAAKNILVQQQSERLISPDEDTREKSDDALTGLYNRKFFESLIIKLSARNVENVSIIYIRISNLLALSDTKGAEAINQLIKDTAAVLFKQADESDICARISKKEFVIIKFNTTKEATSLAVKSLLSELNDMGSAAKFAAGSSFKDKNMTIESVLEEAYEIQSV
jgi:diguanylate cyclase (GGDEF)-like protein